jgi:hypothetical protein
MVVLMALRWRMMASMLLLMHLSDQFRYAVLCESHLFPMLARPEWLSWAICQWLCPRMYQTSSSLYCLFQLLILVCDAVSLLVFACRVACAIPYTCGSSRLFSGAVAGEHSFICKFTWYSYCSLQSFHHG